MLRFPTYLPILASVLLVVSVGCSSAESTPANPNASNQAANDRTGGANNAGSRFQSLNGTIASVTGQQFSLSTSGNTVQVALTDQTRYIKMAPVKLVDLKTGNTITIRGSNDSFGNLIADTVQVLPTDGSGGSGAAGAQGQRQRGGQGGADRANGAGGAGPPGADSNRFQGNNNGGGNLQGNNGGQFQRSVGGTRARGQQSRIVGQVEKVEGTTITISEQNGSTQLFMVNGNTVFLRPLPGARDDLRAGLTASVAGSAGTDGVINAMIVTIGDELAAS